MITPISGIPEKEDMDLFVTEKDRVYVTTSTLTLHNVTCSLAVHGSHRVIVPSIHYVGTCTLLARLLYVALCIHAFILV